MAINPEILDLMVFYLHERERVRLKKEAGEPRPWTSEEALLKYRFTNVLRANDYTTRWLVNNWYEPNKDASLEILLLNAGIARYFGTTEFCEAIGFSHEWDKERIRDIAIERMRNRQKVFTSAYVITNGGVSDAKYNVVLDHYLTPFERNLEKLVDLGVETEEWESMANYMMRNLPGMGGTGFMTKEILSDFILAAGDRIDWKDLYTWSPIGPGAQKGLNWLYDRSIDSKVSKSQALLELREVAAAVGPRLENWMPQFGEELDLHGIQFGLCELAKIAKVRYWGERMKNNYTPRA